MNVLFFRLSFIFLYMITCHCEIFESITPVPNTCTLTTFLPIHTNPRHQELLAYVLQHGPRFSELQYINLLQLMLRNRPSSNIANMAIQARLREFFSQCRESSTLQHIIHQLD